MFLRSEYNINGGQPFGPFLRASVGDFAIQQFAARSGRAPSRLADDAARKLIEYDWPGNVRELENVMERAVVLSSSSRIGADLIPDHVRSAPPFQIPKFVVPPEGISFKDVITNVEKRLIESTLEAAGGVQKRAAELLKIKPTTLNEMIKRYDIRPRRKKASAGAGRDADAAMPEDEEVVEPARG